MEKPGQEAKEIAKDKKRMSWLLRKAMRRAERYVNKIANVYDELMALIRLLRAWLNGSYRKVPWRSIIAAVAALLYFVNPLDVVPDFVPFWGFIDDVAVISFVFNSIRKDINRFMAWEKEQAGETVGVEG